MKSYLRKRWHDWRTKKSLFSKITDLLFILLVIAMLIPASRREIRLVAARLTASSPKAIHEEKQEVVSEQTYNWTLYDLEGNKVPFRQFRGQAIFLNFWASWCAPCIAEKPEIQALYDQFGSEAAFVLVSDESPERIRQFMETRGFDMPVYIRRGGAPPDFASGTIPVSFVIAPDGRIVIRKTGASKWNSSSMQSLMRELIDQS